MHPCFNVDEILRLLASKIVASEANKTAVSLACCCKSFNDPVLDALWETRVELTSLLKCLPQEVWEERDRHFVSQLTVFLLSVLNFWFGSRSGSGKFQRKQNGLISESTLGGCGTSKYTPLRILLFWTSCFRCNSAPQTSPFFRG